MSSTKPKYLFPKGKPYNQYIDRALFFFIGLLLHALPHGARYLFDRTFFQLFASHKHVLKSPGTLVHNSSKHVFDYFADSIINASRHILLTPNSSDIRDHICQISCPLLPHTFDVSTVYLALGSWWTSVVLLVREIFPDSHSTTFLAIIGAIISSQIVAHHISGFRLERFSKLNACLPVKIMPNPFPWKLRRYFELSKIEANLLDEYLFKKYSVNGLTHGLGTVLTKRVKAISTIEVENFKAVLSTKFDDWERPAFRAGAARPFLRVGILTLVSHPLTQLLFLPISAVLFWMKVLLRLTMLLKDGPHWAYSRKVMKPQFTRQQIDHNLVASERHLQNLFHALGRVDYNGWTNTADFMDYFFRFAMDSSTEFLFGLSANTQVCAMVREGKMDAKTNIVDMDGFEEAFKRVQTHIGVRMKVGRSYWMVDGYSYRKACRELGKINDSFIAAAITNAKNRLAAHKNEPRNAIEALVVDGHDFGYISNQCRHLIIAGFETTSALLGFSFALIEQDPEVSRKLRAEVLSRFGTDLIPRQPLNFENLKNCKYMQFVINETLRLYPAGPSIQRVAIRDTVLPRGGGPDGASPIVVPKNSTIQLGIYLAHRRKDIWGEDANEFVPERWEGRKKGYGFIPFLAGPQVCLGQQYSMTQAAYVIARFMMKFDAMEKPIGQDNLRKGWKTVLSPGNGVKLRMRLGEDHRVLSALDFPY
ncbi:hypothetical protein Vi05172_g11252 [Venturia inaequalis]|nr:hypothetical protein Vi05172_g11252 [Venturia inaequalis]